MTTTPNVKTSKSYREDIDIEAGYYIHKGKLGEGGFSKVRLATHLLSREKVAIKCMDKSKLGRDLFRVKTEIAALKVLSHEHIAKLLQVIETEQKIYLVLEYCSGGELFDYIVSQSRLTEKESQHIIACLCRCLDYLHSNGFAHRDLKPENILFDRSHRIKLIDFGLAARSKDAAASLQHLSTCCGSPAYAAPELIAGSEYSGPAVDVWSTGVILYALLVGQLPFDDENMSVLYKKIQSGRYILPSWLTDESKQIIQSMLQIDPAKRITIRQLLKTPWIRDGLMQEPMTVQVDVFDDEILDQISKYYPYTGYAELRQNIMRNFGYQTATYWLLKEKKKSSLNPPIKPPLPLRTSTPNEQKTATSEEKKLEHKADVPQPEFTTPKPVAVKRKPDENTPVARVTPKHIPPRTVAVAARPITDAQRHPTRIVGKTTVASAICTPTRVPRVAVNPLNSPRRPVATTTPFSPPRVPARQSLVPPRVTSPPRSTVKSPLSPTKIPINANYCTPTPHKKRRIVDELKADAKLETPKLDNCKIVDENMKTPKNVVNKITQTPKRSLLKKILATATPGSARQLNPRNITQSAHTATGNITMTKFKDPQQCIEKLTAALTDKGIQCKQKGGFMIRCAMNNVYKNSLTFTLEICKFGESCVIQRKRLRGDAWCYKRICEEILRISNEIPV